MSRRNALTLPTLALLALVACGGGSAPAETSDNGGDTGNRDLNQGSYDKDSFDYRDPYPAEFQPLQSKNFRASRRDEVAVFAAQNNDTKFAVAFDDAGQKGKALGLFGPTVFDDGFAALSSASGSLNAERGDEIAVFGRNGNDFEVVALTADAKGQWSELGKTKIAGSTLGYRSGQIELADVDGDNLDELIVSLVYSRANGGWVRVYDDPSHGFQLLHNLDIAGSIRMQAEPFDEDGDGTDEIVVFKREAKGASFAVLEGATKAFAFRRNWTALDRYAERLVVGSFDQDAAPEIGVVTRQVVGGRYRSYARTYDLTEQGVEQLEVAQLLLDANYVFDAVAVDSNRDGVDEIATSTRTYASRRYYGRFVHWAPKSDRGPRARPLNVYGLPYYQLRSEMAVHDADADGREDVALVGYSNTRRVITQLYYPVVGKNGEFAWTYRVLGNAPLSSVASTIVTAGDFDRENLILRSTGKKWLDLPDPMPIVVLAAPPTRSGISQNYDDSSTLYGTETSTERSHGVSTGWTASFSTGYEAEDIFGAFGASVKQTLSTEMQKTLTRWKKVTWTKTFDGSYDNDVVIFQGTLYQVYEYEIVSAEDDNLIGSKITLNDPVATKTYKWTVDFYNENVPEKARIGSDVITHRVGNPSSYRRKADAETALAARLGWMDTGLEVGAVRGGANSTGVSISDGNSSETSRSFGVDWEAEVKIGGATIGGSFGLTRDEVYGVTVETGTNYEGSVGDIENTAEWSEWRYTFGLLVYRHGADENGNPERGERPFHVVTYWVDDLGPGHTAR